jgi:hypothetical protein
LPFLPVSGSVRQIPDHRAFPPATAESPRLLRRLSNRKRLELGRKRTYYDLEKKTKKPPRLGSVTPTNPR